ncbi:translation initiation factor eIF-2B subunit epsilon isoform X2 [Pseudomyrmex gracilis]|uniref:translation initiation factor eIF-2B subunit epsilon isoform X2 n=1 Tax=Pseudomyrmex gracilis TaxID=219809 RepID=UPI0009955104|nr:translation initiation factor eIF-2B subunit epsilon isoform X2 [Pseudomyrmex gracilis]
MNRKVCETDSLQAVILADEFTTSLSPLQNIYPIIMTPVINISLFDYMIDTLVKSRVQEVFLYCSNHVDLLKKYVSEINCKSFTVSLIISDGCRSLGDALRDIDAKGCIRGYFILIRGNTFTNTDLKTLLNTHRLKVEKDKGTTMTMVLRNVGSTRKSCLYDETCLLVSDKTSKKILHYAKLNNNEKKVKLELNWFLDHSEVELSTCHLDTHIYMCSSSVLPLFADNFDFQTMDDFIRGVLMNEEILDSRIYWIQLNTEDYALPITSWKTYCLLTQDILRRLTYPLTPDALPLSRNFTYMPQNCSVRYASRVHGCILYPGIEVPPRSQYVDSLIESVSSDVTKTKVTKLDIHEQILYSANNEIDECDKYSTDSSSIDRESGLPSSPIPDDTSMFLSEVIDSLLRGYQDKLKCENLILEINSSRYAYNVTMREVTYNVIKAILSLPLHYLSETNTPVDKPKYQKNLKSMIIYFNPIILNYIKNNDAQEDCLRAIEDVASTTDELLPYTQHLLHLFYERDILSEEKILQWYEFISEENDVQHNKVRDVVQPFIKWLEEAEEDSSESDDE